MIALIPIYYPQCSALRLVRVRSISPWVSRPGGRRARRTDRGGASRASPMGPPAVAVVAPFLHVAPDDFHVRRARLAVRAVTARRGDSALSRFARGMSGRSLSPGGSPRAALLPRGRGVADPWCGRWSSRSFAWLRHRTRLAAWGILVGGAGVGPRPVCHGFFPGDLSGPRWSAPPWAARAGTLPRSPRPSLREWDRPPRPERRVAASWAPRARSRFCGLLIVCPSHDTRPSRGPARLITWALLVAGQICPVPLAVAPWYASPSGVLLALTPDALFAAHQLRCVWASSP